MSRTKEHSVLRQCQGSDLAVVLERSPHPSFVFKGMQQTALLLVQAPLALLHQQEAQVALSVLHLAGSVLATSRKKSPYYNFCGKPSVLNLTSIIVVVN